MQTHLAPRLRDTAEGREAESILRSCVHCGFCTATCPTYQLTGDELDGPRGRIYLIKQWLEQPQPDAGGAKATRLHLDRCLTCRSCETTCPSGVQYSRLLEIGRQQLAQDVPRRWHARLGRRVLAGWLVHRRLFSMTLAAARWLRPLVPAHLRARLPADGVAGDWPAARHSRRVLVLQGCVQDSATPGTNAAAARVLDHVGISAIAVARAGCCGAVALHLDDADGARQAARNNIDAWWPGVESGVEAIVASASGCGLMLKEYGQLLADDPLYAYKAQRVSALVRDLAEVLDGVDLGGLARDTHVPVAVHVPCTLQHGQQLPDLLPRLLERAGYRLTQTPDSHLCCGSAGTYSLMQADFSARLLTRKLDALQSGQPGRIVTANVGCQLHLASQAQLPVSHWIELFDPDGTGLRPGSG